MRRICESHTFTLEHRFSKRNRLTWSGSSFRGLVRLYPCERTRVVTSVVSKPVRETALPLSAAVAALELQGPVRLRCVLLLVFGYNDKLVEVDIPEHLRLI